MIKPLADRVLVQLIAEEAKTKSGLILSEPISLFQKATIIALGPGKRTDDGKLHEPWVKVGEAVILSKHGMGHEIEVDGEKYNLLREGEILAVC